MPLHHDTDVVIIGGGLAGLTAARELRHRGYGCTVLESRDRLGGRTFTTDFGGERVEFGGGYVTWAQPYMFSELTRYGIGMFASPAVSPESGFLWTTPDGVRHEPTDQFWEAWSSLLPRFFEDGKRLLPHPYAPAVEDPELISADRLSVQDRMTQLGFSPQDEARVAGIVSAMSAGQWSDVGYTSLLRRYATNNWAWQFVLEVANFEVEGGTGRLVDALAADARPDIRLESPVERVDADGRGVEVRTATGDRFTAGAAVVAVPLNLLSSIDFPGGLHGTLGQLAAEGQPSTGVKVWARMRGHVPASSLFGGGSHPVVMGWPEIRKADGDTILQFFTLRSGEFDTGDIDAVSALLAPYYPEAQVMESGGIDWGSDPWAKGVWEMFRPGQLTRHFRSLQQPLGRLFVAGAYTASGCAHGMDSAIGSGVRVAAQVDSTLRGSAHRRGADRATV